MASMPAVAGLSPLYLAAMVCAITGGATAFSHVNDSGFWLVGSLLEIDEKTTLKSAKVKGKKVTLKWNKVKGASGYEIYCKTGKGKWKLVKTLNKGSKASYKLKGKAGKKYTYKVRAFQKVENKVIYGQYSNTKSAKIKK